MAAPMADLLFLTHRMPFPPEKGDKIRSWHILRHLAQRHRVHLGCFYDDPDDERHIGELAALCASVCCLPLDAKRARLKSLAAFLRDEPMSVAYFRDARLMRWIAETIARHRPSRAFVYCSAMAPYLDDYRPPMRVIDMVDLDSEKWRQYAAASAWPLSAVYRREGRMLLALETRAAERFDYTLFSSAAEARLFARRGDGASARVLAMRNGVDHGFFTPQGDYADPYPPGRQTLVFTGAMDYRPNVEAALWFASEVMPLLRPRFAALDFWIVGAHPARALGAIAGGDIHVTGRVADMRPYLAHADAVVAPLLIARGIQNKVLEGMAMAKPVIASPGALEGLDVRPDIEVLAAATARQFARAVAMVLADGGGDIGAKARARVVADYGWPASLRLLDDIFAAAEPALASA